MRTTSPRGPTSRRSGCTARARRRPARPGLPGAGGAGVHRGHRHLLRRRGVPAEAPATGCGCSRTRSRTWRSRPQARPAQAAGTRADGGAAGDGGGARGRRGRRRAAGRAAHRVRPGRRDARARCCSGTWPGSTRCSATCDPAQVRAPPTATTRTWPATATCWRSSGRAPWAVDAERLRARHPELDAVRLPGSGLVVTLGRAERAARLPGPPGGDRDRPGWRSSAR